jgi:hypothetical protein
MHVIICQQGYISVENTAYWLGYYTLIVSTGTGHKKPGLQAHTLAQEALLHSRFNRLQVTAIARRLS